MIESDGLVIQNVNRDNAGTYTCRARVPETGELEERDIQLDVSTCRLRFSETGERENRDIQLDVSTCGTRVSQTGG